MKRFLITAEATFSALEAMEVMHKHKDLRILYAVNNKLSVASYLNYINKINCDYENKETLLDEIKKNNINYILPLGGYKDLLFWANKKDALEKDGIKVLTNLEEAIVESRDKLGFYNKLRKNGISYPRIYRSRSEIDFFPLIAKHRFGGKIAKLDSMRDVHYYTEGRKDVIVQRAIFGDEIRVEFIKIGNKFLCCMRIVDNVGLRTCPISEELRISCEDVANIIGVEFGSMHIMMDKEEVFYFLDIMPRFSRGGMLLSSISGIDVLDLLIKSIDGDTLPELNFKSVRSLSFIGQILMASDSEGASE